MKRSGMTRKPVRVTRLILLPQPIKASEVYDLAGFFFGRRLGFDSDSVLKYPYTCLSHFTQSKGASVGGAILADWGELYDGRHRHR